MSIVHFSTFAGPIPSTSANLHVPDGTRGKHRDNNSSRASASANLSSSDNDIFLDDFVLDFRLFDIATQH